MTQVRNNGIEVPVPSDPYNPPADMAKMADTTEVIRRVSSDTAMNSITGKRPGTPMVRTDWPGQPMFTWSGADDSAGAWIAVAPELEFGQGNSRGIIKGREVLVTTTEFSTGRVVFETPFPNACRGITLTHSTGALTVVNFRITDKQPSYAEFVAYNASGAGLPSSAIYVNYVAVGF
ncbi:gp53-like domain-containing protein [Arthrobacter sp. C152]